ncbi:unnamed protein product [Ambrosiozyma monospora]|uniref:Unnamed protein product n=1 Tax=Ambrosiozyma monospora TaxID=43982 RepID=A0ACB5T099_AMBMO|nr:unnamed protein product [Ambrosiozyma monospora]
MLLRTPPKTTTLIQTANENAQNYNATSSDQPTLSNDSQQQTHDQTFASELGFLRKQINIEQSSKPSSEPSNIITRVRRYSSVELNPDDFDSNLPPLPPIPNPEILERVFTHDSFVNVLNIDEQTKLQSHNQRLENLGDAFLNFISALILYELFPEFDEGKLTILKAKIINNQNILKWARGYKFDAKLRKNFSDHDGDLGDGKVYSDVFEAYMGAIVEYYISETIDGKMDLDQVGKGHLYAKEWIGSLASGIIQNAKKESKTVPDIDKNAKQDLNLMLDLCYKVKYLTVSATPDSDSKFVSCVRIDDKILGYGVGGRKKVAETRAAMDAIDNPYSIQFFSEQLRLKSKDQIMLDDKRLDCVVSSHPNVPDDYLQVLSLALAKEQEEKNNMQ